MYTVQLHERVIMWVRLKIFCINIAVISKFVRLTSKFSSAVQCMKCKSRDVSSISWRYKNTCPKREILRPSKYTKEYEKYYIRAMRQIRLCIYEKVYAYFEIHNSTTQKRNRQKYRRSDLEHFELTVLIHIDHQDDGTKHTENRERQKRDSENTYTSANMLLSDKQTSERIVKFIYLV